MKLLELLRPSRHHSITEIDQIRERVRTMRDQVGHRDISLVDLFAMLREDERRAFAPPRAIVKERPRVHPDDVPTLKEAR